MKQFVAGTAYDIITPPLGTLLYGYPKERPADRVLDDLRVNVAVFGYEKPSACLINLDLCSINTAQVEYLSGVIEETTGIPRNSVIISAIHTHSGPCITGAPGWGGCDENYINNTLYPKVIETVKDAALNAVPVKMGVGTTESLVGINRRQYSLDGVAQLGQRAYGAFDPTMTVISFRDYEGNGVVNIVHYGCHGTAMGHDPAITRDWCGYMVDALEQESGATTLYINGTEGDTGPRISNGYTCGNEELTRELGMIAIDDALKAYGSIGEYEDVKFSVEHGKLELPYRPLESLEVINDRLANIEILKETVGEGWMLLVKTTLEKRKEYIESGKAPETHMSLDQVIFRFNSVVLVPYQFEVFAEIGLRLRDHSPFEHTLTISNANGALGYFPSKIAEI